MEKTGFIEIRITGTRGNLDQRAEAGDVDRSDLRFVELIDYQPN